MILLALATYTLLAHEAALPSPACAQSFCMQMAVQTPAPALCPWLAKGTASAALGGDVTSLVAAPENLKGSCKYSLLTSPTKSIEVEVDTLPLAACPATATALKGIGNEALRCKLSSALGYDAEKISGRVRNHYFTVTIHIPAQPQTKADSEPDWLQRIAEQVAGNLF